MSGGVVLDRTGAVIGITSAGSIRRGRIMTSRPTAIWDTVRQGGQLAQSVSGIRPAIEELTADSYPVYGQAAIQDSRVARVICRRK